VSETPVPVRHRLRLARSVFCFCPANHCVKLSRSFGTQH
jgi:hypothetical protein